MRTHERADELAPTIAGRTTLPPAGSSAPHSPAGKDPTVDLQTARAALLRVEANLCTDETNVSALKVGALSDSIAIPLLIEHGFKNQRALVNLLLALLPESTAALAPIDDAAVQRAQAEAIAVTGAHAAAPQAFLELTRPRPRETVGEVSISDSGGAPNAP
jgi:hypothetical protein